MAERLLKLEFDVDDVCIEDSPSFSAVNAVDTLDPEMGDEDFVYSDAVYSDAASAVAPVILSCRSICTV